MPIYEYRCDHCQATFEIRASFREREAGLKPACPKCQSVDAHQVLSAGVNIRAGSVNGDRQPSSCCTPNSRSGCCGR